MLASIPDALWDVCKLSIDSCNDCHNIHFLSLNHAVTVCIKFDSHKLRWNWALASEINLGIKYKARWENKYVFLIPAMTDFFKILKYFCYFSYLLHNFVSETVVMKINAKKCMVITYNHSAHTFFKLAVKQWGNNKNYKGLSIFRICQLSLWNLNFTQKWIEI